MNGIPLGNFLKMVMVDLIDDLEMTRQNILQHTNRPPLECFWEHGVVSVCEHFNTQTPCLGPAQSLNIKEYAHHLRDCHGWMSVIQLNGNLSFTSLV